MKILFLCHRIPYPPKRGGKIRPFNMIRHLSRRHAVTVVTVARSAREQAEAEPLRGICRALHSAVIPPLWGWGRFALDGPTTYPSTFGYFYSARLHRTVRALLAREGFEAIVVHSSSMGPYVVDHQGCRKVMDFGDADSEKWLEYGRRAVFPLSAGFAWEGHKVRRWERRLGARFDVCSVNTEAERQVLARYVPTPIEVITNGVDLDYFRPAAGAPPYRPHRLVFTGNMSYPPNVDAVKHLVADILPRIRPAVPDVELYIVGMDPARAVQRLEDRPRIVVTGRVDDVRPFVTEAAVSVAPLRVARGLQNKVLEALALGVPVVASPEAFAGVQATAGRDLLVAGGPDEFARAVVQVLGDAGVRDRLGAAGRACVEGNHDWDLQLERLEALVTAGRPPVDGPAPFRTQS